MLDFIQVSLFVIRSDREQGKLEVIARSTVEALESTYTTGDLTETFRSAKARGDLLVLNCFKRAGLTTTEGEVNAQQCAEVQRRAQQCLSKDQTMSHYVISSGRSSVPTASAVHLTEHHNYLPQQS